jgi:PAS domain S-box-containing protein
MLTPVLVVTILVLLTALLRERSSRLRSNAVSREIPTTDHDTDHPEGTAVLELAEAMPQIVYVSNVTGRIEYINQHWRQYTGLSSADVDVLASVVHPDDIQGLNDAWAEALNLREQLTCEFRLRRESDGMYRWFLTRATPVTNAQGVVVRWYGTSTDIHEIRSVRSALEVADRKKDEFIAALAHELRNPLAPIRNAIGILKLSTTGSELPWALGIMERQIAQMIHMIDDLMDVSRVSEGKIALKLEIFDFRDVVAEALDAQRLLLSVNANSLSAIMPESPVMIRADQTRVAQIITNLVNNAVKYSDAGGRIVVSLNSGGGDAVLTVKDNGIGIPADKLETVFEMFSQVRDGANRAKGGLGIGLSLVRRFVTLLGGVVHAESEGLGQGSTFTVRLPLQNAAARETNGGKNALTAAGSSAINVLLVDDSEDAATSMAALLEYRGAVVRTAFNGLDAVKAAREFRPDAIVLDISLPGIDGYEVCRRVLSESWSTHVALIALTGWAQDSDRQSALAAGFDQHVVKPAHPDDLIRILRTSVTAKRRPAEAAGQL